MVLLVHWQGMKPAVIGIAGGLIVSLASGRLLSRLLFQVSATDPATIGAVAILLAIVVAAACLTPARRALHIPPASALRSE